MKIRKLNLGQTELIRLRRPTGEPFDTKFSKGAEVQLFKGKSDQIMLRRGKVAHEVVANDRSERRSLAYVIGQRPARIAWIVVAKPKKRARTVQVKIHTFHDEKTLPDLSIGVDEAIVERVAELRGRASRTDEAIRWLGEQCFLPAALEGSSDVRAFLSAGASQNQELKDNFQIHGRSFRLTIRGETADDGEGRVFVVKKLIKGKSRSKKLPLFLVRGHMEFRDATEAGKIRAETAAQLADVEESDDSFLATWREYGRIESEGILRRVQEFGSVKFESCEVLEDGSVRFDLVDTPNLEKRLVLLSIGDTLEVLDAVPDYISRPDLTWAEYEELSRADRNKPRMVGKVVEPLNVSAGVLHLRSEDEPPPLDDKGALVLSILGDRVRLRRRQQAQEAISGARCGIFHLGKLLEGIDVSRGEFGTTEALTYRVRQRVFPDGREPTPRQEEAIAAVINTPDLVLIQGPPGTGKTTVIRAAVERLNELIHDPSSITGQILVSGFQHDAVENAIQRIEINDLPSIKFGKRMGEEYIDEEERRIDRWRRRKVEDIRSRIPDVHKTELHRQLARLVEGYVLAPGPLPSTVRLLRRVAELVRGRVRSAVIDRLANLADRLERELRDATAGEHEQAERIRLVRAIRCHEVSFPDDGARNAHLARSRLERDRLIDGTAVELLGRASMWTDEGAPPFLPDLARLRHDLLLQFIPSGMAEPFRARHRADVSRVLSEARDALREEEQRSMSAPDAALSDYVYELDIHPGAVRRAIIEYTPVFGLTCGQAAGKWVREVVEDHRGEYDSVLVDEAARANPLDLFIPLTLARRRIALVGDHKQLPHLVDQQLARELEQVRGDDRSAKERVQEIIQTSLFQRLFELFEADKAEYPDRVRTVMLDEQFRMHPVLGDFISQQFYGGDLRSPLLPVQFQHALPGLEGKIAAWLEVPATSGFEIPGRSKSRPVEAQAIAGLLRQLMDADRGNHLSFGVITFYSAQVQELQKALVDEEILIHQGGEWYEASEPYRELRDHENRLRRQTRLRVGTVDAFQGREFDVVLLSMVRSNDIEDVSTEKDRRKKWGHLMSPNRLCVALSRQKRLLIVAGDSKMLGNKVAAEDAAAEDVADVAAEVLEPLVVFHRDLCGGEHGALL